MRQPYTKSYSSFSAQRDQERKNSPYSEELENYRTFVMSNPIPNAMEIKELKRREALEDAERQTAS